MKKLLAGIVCAVFLVLCAEAGGKSDAKAEASGFVTVKKGQFMLNGKEFRFAGTNNYYMHYSSDKMQTDVLDAAVGMDFKVLRIWGFFNGLTSINRDHNVYGMTEPAMDGAPGSYGIPENKKSVKGVKDAFERLDFTVAEAGKRNIKLVVALNNYWADFGGLQQASTWQKWFGLKKPTDFYSDPRAKEAYKSYINFMLTRVNSYTGIPYSKDPTIMTWQLMNEPRNPDDKTGKVVTAWADEMSAYIKKLAPMQLCSVGDEGGFNRAGAAGFMNEGSHMYIGTEGTDFDALLKLKNIDYGTYHMYPEGWGIVNEAVEGWGVQYIKDHIAAGRTIGKPVVLEEYGTVGTGMQNRLAVYDTWNKTVFDNGGAGTMVWILTASNDRELGDTPPGDGIYDDYDGYRVMNDSSPVSNMLRMYAKKMAGEQVVETPRAYLLSPSKAQGAKGFYRIRAQVIPVDKTVKEGRLFVDGNEANLLQYNKEQDVYRFNFDTIPIKDGSNVRIKAVFTFTDGTSVETEENSLTIANVVTYSVYKKFDFAEDVHGAESLGAYQATLVEIKHTKLNGGMIEVVSEFPGTNEWEEMKVKFQDLKEIAQGAKIQFTVYLEKNKAIPSATKSKPELNLPGIQSYIAFEPGWVKTGLAMNNKLLKDLEVVKLDDGKEYYKQTTALEFFQNPAYIGICICPTLGFVQYSGSVYIDDLIVYKKD